MGAVLYGYAITALICAGILIVVIYVTYSINKRMIKVVFQKKPATVNTEDTLVDSPKKSRWIDLWLIIFVLYAVGITVLNTIG